MRRAIGVLATMIMLPLFLGQTKTELGLVPLVGGSTDLGIGVGVLGSVARLAPDHDPYTWHMEFAAFTAMKNRDGHYVLPYQDYYALLTLPDLAENTLRTAFRVSFTRSELTGYYGIGNASIDATRIPGVSSRYDQYERLYPAVRADMRVKLEESIYLRIMPLYTHNLITLYPDSKLMTDLSGRGDARSAALLRVPSEVGVPLLHVGLVWDSRDSEVSTTRGGFHEISLRGAPVTLGGGGGGFGGANLTTRYFAPLWGDRIVLAGRFVADMLFGDPPVFELTQIEELSMLGGEFGVRGIPVHRFAGETKMLGNIEIRATLLNFRAVGQDFALGTVAFFDAGRVLAKHLPIAELDGTGLGLHWGTGGGVRVLWGETFVVRADIAWSPDANPVGAYLNAGQTF